MLARFWSIIPAISLMAVTLTSAAAVEFVVSDTGPAVPARAQVSPSATVPQHATAAPPAPHPPAIPTASSPDRQPESQSSANIQTVDVTLPVETTTAPRATEKLIGPQAANGYPDPSIPFEDSRTPPDLPDVTVPIEPYAIQDPAAQGSAMTPENECAACGETMADGSCACGQVDGGAVVDSGGTSDFRMDDSTVGLGIRGGSCSDACGGCGCGCGCGQRPAPKLSESLGGLFGLQGCTCSGSGCQRCGDDEEGWFLNLWVNSGYTYNSRDPASGSNLPLTFNDRDEKYLLNQLYLSFGRAVSTTTWDVGGRLDLLYGSDYFFTTALGLETFTDGSQHWNSSIGPRPGAALYGLAMPQLYAEFGVPFAAGTSVKVGHFYTILGYESVMAPENFFYSHAYTMQYGEPFTHTGVLGDVAVTKSLNVMAGITRGWDTWEDPNHSAGFLFGCSWCPTPLASVSFGLHSSPEDDAGDTNRTVYSLVYTRQLSNRVQYVLQHDFGTESLAEFDVLGEPDSAKWYGINQYMFYEANECLTWGARIEWFRDQDNARVLGVPSETLVQGGNYVGLSFGANYRPNSRWIFRPEIRWDWSDVVPSGLGANGMFNDFQDDSQLTLAYDVILRF